MLFAPSQPKGFRTQKDAERKAPYKKSNPILPSEKIAIAAEVKVFFLIKNHSFWPRGIRAPVLFR